MMLLAAIGIGGFVGAISRFLVSQQVDQWFSRDFPYGTLTVNAFGSFLLGFLIRYFGEHVILSEEIRMGLTVGGLGAFTTFSTFSFQTIILFNQGDYMKGGINVLSNMLICLIFCVFGMHLTKYI